MITLVPMNRLKMLIRDPLIHFLILGALLYAAIALPGGDSDREKIVINDGEIDRIKSIYRQQFGLPPSTAQLEQLVEKHIREEIYWREGIALSLHRNDEIVRRRVAQKYAFLQEDLAAPSNPAPAELASYFEKHRDRYTEPARVSFSHVFIARNRGEGDRHVRLDNIRSRLEGNPATTSIDVGDRFPGQREIVQLNRRELIRMFGDTPIVRAAFNAPSHQWAGPFSSGFGDHFIRVARRTAERSPPLEEVRDRVLADYRSLRRRDLEQQRYARLRDKYEVLLESSP